MNKLIISSFLLLFCFNAKAQNFTLDVLNSSISWIGYGEVGGYQQQGTINPKEGELLMNEDEISEGEVVVDMKSISHVDKELQEHLKQKDFFFIKKFPEAILSIVDMNDEEITANVEIRGITNEIRFPISLSSTPGQVVAKGKVTIDRTTFDIKYNSSSYFQDLGSYAIKNDFDLVFDLTFVSAN